MATYNLGFLKVNTDDGFAYRIGNGAVHRFGQGKKQRPAVEGAYDGDMYAGDGRYGDGYAETDADAGYARYDGGSSYGGYDGDGYGSDGGYDDGYGRASRDGGYRGGDYGDDGYGDDGYGDDSYDDGSYGDDSYGDDSYGDGGYGDEDDRGYGDDGYGGGDYDDRYQDEDAGDYPSEGGYGDENPILRYVDENDWVTYVLLVLLPPLGIYLLWRRRLFEQPVRWAVSAVSGIWCVLLLILLFSAVLSGIGDTTANPSLTFEPPATVEAVSVTQQPNDSLLQAMTGASPSPSAGANVAPGATAGAATIDGIAPAQTADLLAPDATATPLPGANGQAVTSVSSGTVLVTATDPYYHNNPSCANLDSSQAISNLTEDVALQRNKTPCPLCYPGIETYYHTADGKYYHKDPNCSNMTNATPITKDAAEKAGQPACPVCITKELVSLDSKGLIYCDANTTDRSGINVYCTQNGANFHVNPNCRGMVGAQSVGLLQAMLAGKTACTTCAATAGRQVWFTKGGTRFHNKSDCDKMTGARQATLAEALILGKVQCTLCWGDVKLSFTGNGAGATTTVNTGTQNANSGTPVVVGGTVYVYATKDGTYYHTNPTCSNMTDAQRVPLKTMLEMKRPACPICASSANTVVYATKDGDYYHSYATCGGMKNAATGTLAQAMALGKKRCPNCWGQNGGTTQDANTTAPKASGTYVYATRTSNHYHTNPNCSGMTNAERVDLAVAVQYGKTACPTCASAASRSVYSNDDSQYYHARSDCSGTTGMKRRTLQSALLLGQKMCPVCRANAGGTGAAQAVTNVQTHQLPNGATNGGVTSAVSGATVQDITGNAIQGVTGNAIQGVTGSAIQGFSSSAVEGVTSNAIQGVTGHAVEDLAGSGFVQNAQEGSIVSSQEFQAGSSGVKVYASAGDRYYHGYRQHAGADARQVSLETALNYGKTACPTCLRVAQTTVYAVRGGRYYHSSKTCAGVGAVAGKLSSALAYGLDACPVCVTRTKQVTSTNTYKSGASGIKVWATVSGNYYHVSHNCAGASATQITLETAMNYGKTACPNCSASAKKTVYSTAGDQYYHSSRNHAGDSASAGQWATALALGKKACPVCIGGSEAYEESDVKYSAPADTQVYIDVDSTQFYYHKNASCNDAGVHGGTGVALEFALGWGFKACPYCNPATSVK